MLITAHGPGPHTGTNTRVDVESLINNSQAICFDSHQGSQAWASCAGDATRDGFRLDFFCQEKRSWSNAQN